MPLKSERVPERWHAVAVDRALVQLKTTPQGLDDGDAAERLARVGHNVISAPPAASAWRILVDQMKSVVVLLLFAALLVSATMGDLVDAIAIGAVLVLNVALGFVLELRGRRAMESLRALDVPEATVVRGGRVRTIDARDIVPGDVIQLDAGAAVPADARIVSSSELQTNEAALTGESVPVSKQGAELPPRTPLPDRTNMVYKATSVTNGSARAVIVTTGMQTEIGRIGTLVASIRDEPTPLERRLAVLGKRLAVASVAVGAVVAALELLRGSALAAVIQTGIAVAVAAVPEGLPAVVTITMAIGIRRMAARNALIRQLPAVESLGSATVVCTDKTGTLTAGEQTVTAIWTIDEAIDVSGAGYEPRGTFTRSRSGDVTTPDTVPDLAAALRIGALCNHAGLAHVGGEWRASGDPTEAALLVVAGKAGLDAEALRREWPPVGELPFSSARMLMATFHRSQTGAVVAMVKGAPARVLDRCTRAGSGDGPLDAATREAIDNANREMAERGLRVIAVAHGPVERADESAVGQLTFVGLVGMIDPPAAGVANTIGRLREAGIRTIMLTGDQRGTALAVARELGLARGDATIIEGGDVDALSDAELTARVGDAAAFSRVSPEAKLRIVSALRRRGEVVAMLGDGVNDAAALKQADIGVAMGRRGTDVAKDAAGVILTDDRFETVAVAVEEQHS